MNHYNLTKMNINIKQIKVIIVREKAIIKIIEIANQVKKEQIIYYCK